MLEVHLHDFRRVAAVGQSRRRKRNRTDGDTFAPLIDPLAALSRTGAQIIECVLPARFFGKGGIGRVEIECRDVTDRFRACLRKRSAGAR